MGDAKLTHDSDIWLTHERGLGNAEDHMSACYRPVWIAQHFLIVGLFEASDSIPNCYTAPTRTHVVALCLLIIAIVLDAPDNMLSTLDRYPRFSTSYVYF
jgi:hypothetical protein